MRDADLFAGDAALAAGTAWLEGRGIRGALERYGLTLEGVHAWCAEAERSCLEAATMRGYLGGTYVGGIAAALIVGIELGRRER